MEDISSFRETVRGLYHSMISCAASSPLSALSRLRSSRGYQTRSKEDEGKTRSLVEHEGRMPRKRIVDNVQLRILAEGLLSFINLMRLILEYIERRESHT